MNEILKLILDKESIYERELIYKNMISNKFNVVDKIPIIYKVKNKDELLNILNREKIENDFYGENFGVLYLFINQLDLIPKIQNELNGQFNFDFSYPINFQDINSNFNSCTLELSNSKNLTGQGVVIAFIDTGIDYTLDAFRNEDGTTRIKYIYNPNKNILYNSEEINRALNSENPLEIVSETDLKGHGTNVASLACAGGKIEKNLYGVAPKSEIISVNTTSDIDSTQTLFHTIMKSLDFLEKKQKEHGFPLVVNLSFSTNFGAHTGKSILDDYVSNFAMNKNISVVVSAGNEGGAAHHKSGIITELGEEVNIEITGEHKSIPISLYKCILSDIYISVNSPKTGSTQNLKILEGTQVIKLGGNSITILFTGPNNYNMQGDIQIILNSDRNEYVEQGIWNIKLSLANGYETKYDMWLPITESIGNKTRFLDPDNNNTLGSPATVFNVISVGSYNYRTETVSIFSGRGELTSCYSNVKPDVLAPGEEVRVINPGGRVSTVSGTSFSAPIVSGICGLLMEWGIVKNNKPNLYGEVIKYFLVRGATRLRNINYPNNSYGYGFVCASRSLNDIDETIANVLSDAKNNFDEREDLNLFNFDMVKWKICPLNVFDDPTKAEFIGVVDKNFEQKNSSICIYPLESQTDDEIISIISIPIDEIKELEAEYLLSENILIKKTYFYSSCIESVSPLTDSGIYQTQNNEYLNLTGRDVIVGIIDTGIDYLNKEFMDELGETRILEIWDQTIKDDNSNGEVLFGKVYKREQINNAIKLKENGGDPYTIVPSRDTVGHGTSMAGITSGAGNGNVKGGAPSSNLAIVKLREISNEFREYLDFEINDIPIYNELPIYLALRYLKKLKSKYNKPMVVLIPLQTNGGDHSGNTIIGNQITKYSESTGFIVVVPSGNQANKQIHTTGIVEKIGDEGVIELFVDKGQRKLIIDLYIENFAKASLIVVSPSGERTNKFNLSFGSVLNYKFLFELTKMRVMCTIEKNSIEMVQYIELFFEDLKQGLWQIILVSEDSRVLKYNAYLGLREFLRQETKFLNSSSNNTVTSPATSRLAISTAYYNQNYTSIVAESGQGYTLDGRVSPIIATGGIDILTTGKNGTERVISGSSVSAAVATGGIALILEWGIVQKNIIQLNASLMIWLLVSAATLPRSYVFPNKYWGYGLLNIRNVFEILR